MTEAAAQPHALPADAPEVAPERDLLSKFDGLIAERQALLDSGVTDPFAIVMEQVKSPTEAVIRGGDCVTLTPREVGIVRWLYRHRHRVVSRTELLERVFGQRGDLQTRAVDMAISVLRRKLETNPDAPAVIVSVKGAGYAWKPAAPSAP